MNSESKTNKTYVWVRLRGDNGGNTLLTATTTSSNAQARRRIGNTVADKKRGAPTSASGAGSEEEDVWGWTPGFYCSKEDGNGSSDDGNNQEPSSSGGDVDPRVHFTLLPLHFNSADNNSNSDDNNDFHQTEYTLTESQTTALLSSGDIVLANQWEQHDFVNRLQLGNDTSDHDDESDYNYDESDSDSDDSTNNNKHRQISHLFDAQEDTPPPNLIDLTHLHECSVVHALRYRYQNTHISMSNIYTDTGPILLAVNPFKNDESGDLYGEGTARRYRVDGERRWLSERTPGGGSSAVSSLPSSSKNSSAQHETGLGEGSPSSSSSSLSPHVFAVADRTFRTMMTRLHPPDADTLSTPNATSTPAPAKSISPVTQQDKPKVDQSVLVSGESGAGKTVTTKLLMGYLAKLSEQPSPEGGAASEESSDDSNIMSIERRVLESNPIMESFGNARTVRNDNSSRFGKYIEMKFSSSLKQQQQHSNDNKVAGATLVGASIETYLLEKVRLVHQSQGERNYHIFYELFSMKYNEEEGDDDNQANQALLERFGLIHYDMEDFSLINTSDTYDRRDGVSDADTFRDMKRAMTIMGIPTTEQHSVFAVCCALLHASNLNFVDIGEVECALETENPHLEYVVDLLGITRDGLNKALCYYEITIGGCGGKSGETHRRELSQAQAKKGVEALIKATYGAMFQYLVDRINNSIAGDAKSNGGGSSSRPNNRRKGELHGTIGILDIFGFESFQVNSFEQLCINYCNEALQQQFNRFVLRNEQEEYDKEGIPWSFIEFPENQDVLDLIDQKGSGILNVLHDQCRTPGASDKSFALLMYDKCASHSRFEADSRQVAEQLFAVHHYAGLVEYDIEGFVEKNKDELPKEASDLLLSSNNEFVRTLAEILQPSTSAGRNKIMSPRSGASQRPTVGVQFSSQLHSLRSKIDETSPHYIRCLKPNNLLAPDLFDAALIADQLRCAGVIEAVRVSRLGYPQRYSHNQFISRYRILGMKALKKKKNSPKKFNPAKALVHAVKAILKVDDNQDDIGIQVGKSKVFLKRDAYDTLERLRRDKITSSVVVIQKNARCYVYRKHHSKACKAVLSIQCFLRCSSAKNEANRLKRQHRSIIIQSYWRRYLSRKLLLSAKIIAIWCQSHLRGVLGRKMYNAMDHDRKAIYLQSIWRRYVAVSSFKRHRCAAVTIQCAIRSHKSRAKLSQLKSDARDLHAVLIERDMLRQEVIELKKMTQDRKVDQVSTVVVNDANSSIAEKDTEIASLRSALDYMSSEKERVERELNDALQTLVSVKEQKDNYAKVSKALQIEMNALDEKHKAEMKRLPTDLSAMKTENQQLRERKDDAQLLVVGAAGADSRSQPVGKLDDTPSNDLRQEIARLTDVNSKLQQENYDLSEKHASHIKAVSDFSRRETVLAANTSVCTSFTADITDTEEDMSKLREENQILRKQLELLRGMGPNDVIPDDQEYDESVVPDEEGSAASSEKGFIDDTHVVYAASSDKSDQDERIRLQQLINELREELKQTKKRAKYDLDDVNRVNASLRRDLERAEYTSTALNDELDLRYEEYETLQEDMEKFAETFATQHEELQQLERRLKKLTSENEALQSSNKDKLDKIINLEAQVATLKTAQSRAPEWVGDEIGKLWSEISRLKRDEMESASHTSK